VGVKRLDREADHSPPFSTEVKNAWRCTSSPQCVFMAWCLVKTEIRKIVNWIVSSMHWGYVHFVWAVEVMHEVKVKWVNRLYNPCSVKSHFHRHPTVSVFAWTMSRSLFADSFRHTEFTAFWKCVSWTWSDLVERTVTRFPRCLYNGMPPRYYHEIGMTSPLHLSVHNHRVILFAVDNTWLIMFPCAFFF